MNTKRYLMDLTQKWPLNVEQVEAVKHIDGAMLVTAGPGTGKTRTLVSRVGYLIHHGITPENLLVITFTNKAVEEMKERLKALPGITKEQVKRVNCQTIHSLLLSILRQENYKFDVLDSNTQQNIIRNLLEKKGLEGVDPQEIILQIILWKNKLLRPEGIQKSEEFADIYRDYEKYKEINNLVDFEDYMLFCLDLFKNSPNILDKYRKRFPYILVDEFQDTSKSQFELIKMLAAPSNNLWVVGDDDQAIYAFRGTQPEFIVNFNQYFPQSRVINLNINYRSCPNIVDAYNNLIGRNKTRLSKEIIPSKTEISTPQYLEFSNTKQQAEYIQKTILELKKQGYAYSDIAVLYRTHEQSQIIMEVFLDNKVPMSVEHNFPILYEQFSVRIMLAYMKLIDNPNDLPSVLEILPSLYVPNSLRNKLVDLYKEGQNCLLDCLGGLPLSESTIKRINRIFGVLKGLSKQSATNIMRGVREQGELDRYLLGRNTSDESIQLGLRNLDELDNVAQGKSTTELLSHAKAVLSGLNQLRKRKSENGVKLLTVHASKGLEFPVVFMINASEGLFPHFRNTLAKQIEEERRLFYVGVSRAKERLFIAYPKKSGNSNLKPSRFIREMKGVMVTDLVQSRQIDDKPIASFVPSFTNNVINQYLCITCGATKPQGKMKSFNIDRKEGICSSCFLIA